MTDQQQDETSARVAALSDEFPGYQFSWTGNDNQTAGQFHISAQETESWANGEVQSASGNTIDEAIAAMRSALGSSKS